MLEFLDAINAVVLDAAAQPWVLVVLFACCIIDGIFPPVPSESLVVGLAAIAIGSGAPNVWLVMAVAAVGAIIGDNTAYLIGRTIGTQRFAWMRRPTVAAAFDRAGRELSRRSAAYILTARYVPVGRVAVNMTAGAAGMPHGRFIALSIVAGSSWAAYSVTVGVLAGQWVEDNPLLGMTLAIGLALCLGVLVDHLAQRRLRARDARRAALEAQRAPEPEPDAVGP